MLGEGRGSGWVEDSEQTACNAHSHIHMYVCLGYAKNSCPVQFWPVMAGRADYHNTWQTMVIKFQNYIQLANVFKLISSGGGGELAS